MATRKSGDGTRDGTRELDGAEAAGASPGSYVKVSGSRRRRKAKKGRSVAPEGVSAEDAPRSSEQAIAAVLDVEGEETTNGAERADSSANDSREDTQRRTQPDWGVAPRVDERDYSIDDLRRKPSSSRALRKPHGPLGMEDVRTEEPLCIEAKRESPLPPASNLRSRAEEPRASSAAARMNVVEINPADYDHDNQSLHPLDDDPRAFERPAQSEQPAPGRRLFDEDDDELADGDSDPHPSGDPYGGPRDQRRDDADEIDRIVESRLVESNLAPRMSMSSVLDARASMHPSPPPQPEKISLLWWVVVSLLSAIIVAAGVIAVRESMRKPGVDVADAPNSGTPSHASDGPAVTEPDRAPALSPAAADPHGGGVAAPAGTSFPAAEAAPAAPKAPAPSPAAAATSAAPQPAPEAKSGTGAPVIAGQPATAATPAMAAKPVSTPAAAKLAAPARPPATAPPPARSATSRLPAGRAPAPAPSRQPPQLSTRAIDERPIGGPAVPANPSAAAANQPPRAAPQPDDEHIPLNPYAD